MTLAAAKPSAVAAWTLDEASGSRADQVGSITLTDNNTVTSGTGKFGNAADFESANSEKLTITDNAAVSMGDIDFMFRAWVNLESTGADRTIIGKAVAADITKLEYQLYYASSLNRFQFRVFSDGAFANRTEVNADNLGAPSTGTWYLIHAWHDATNNQIGIAVNAGTANTAAHSTGVFDGTGVFCLGELEQFGQFWDGLLDDPVILKGYLLDATERTEDYNSGTGVAFADWDAGGGGATAVPVFRRHYQLMQTR